MTNEDLRLFEARIRKSVAAKYEAIIEERVAETVAQRMKIIEADNLTTARELAALRRSMQHDRDRVRDLLARAEEIMTDNDFDDQCQEGP